jgi:hypothetical protein
MTRRLVLTLPAAVATAALMGTSPLAAATPPDAEDVAIEALIQRVAAMTKVSFARNGTTATSAEAAKHMRDKYAYFRRDIVTAEDFVRLCGTRSELTKRAYTVRMPDGTERPAADLLLDELRSIRARPR